jgi:hypothetical protein
MDVDDLIVSKLQFCPVCGKPLVVETTGSKGCDEHGGFSMAYGWLVFSMLIDGRIPRMF